MNLVFTSIVGMAMYLLGLWQISSLVKWSLLEIVGCILLFPGTYVTITFVTLFIKYKFEKGDKK